jgi:hypothetical protein
MKFTPFNLLYGEQPVTPQEIKLHNGRTSAETIHNPTEAESKELLEAERMKVVKNLQSYQNKIRAWRDKKSKAKAYQSRRSSIDVKPANRSLRKAGAEMDRTLPSDRKNKTRIFLFDRH